MVSGAPSRPSDVLAWWNEISELFVKYKDTHVISERCDQVVSDLADSGEFEEWDIKICNGGFKIIDGTTLERPIAEESRKSLIQAGSSKDVNSMLGSSRIICMIKSITLL